MSRLIVKGLPNRMTEAKLAELFKQHGELTNIQLKYTPGGKFRNFAFVGFKAKESAEVAMKELDRTFVEGSKLTVEVCAKLGEGQNRKTWSKYSIRNQSALTDKNQKKPEVKTEAKAKKKPNPDDPEYEEYQEFISLHKKKSERQKWTDGAGVNDDDATDGKDGDDDDDDDQRDSGVEESDLQFLKSKRTAQPKVKEEEAKVNNEEVPEKPEQKALKYGVLPTIKVRGLPCGCKKKQLKSFLLPLKPFNIRMPGKVKGIAYVVFKNPDDVTKALNKHRSFLEGKRIFITRYEKKETFDEKEAKFQRFKTIEEKLRSEEEPVGESGRIFVRNLPYSATEEDIEELFKPFGELSEVNLPVNKTTRRNMGIAFVSFMFPEHAAKAFESLDGEIFQGRLLHLLPAKPCRKTDTEQEAESNFKEKKKQELKSTAMAAQHSWNSLFLGANAVVDVMAERYRVSKNRVLDNGGDTSAAVRTALGETEIVAETRKFLVQNGVSLDAFSRPPKKRSKRVILVKNLPARTNSDDVKSKFEKFGVVEKVILPPTGVTAIVVMDNPSEARNAFKTLAYSQFKRNPLYLEWAPQDVFEQDRSGEEVEVKTEEVKVKEEPDLVDDEPPEPQTTVFVKNLNFDTTDEDLMQHFRKCGKIHSATVSRKPDPKRKGQTLSLGYGFVQYKKRDSTQRALKELQHSRLDEHVLELKLSHRTVKDEPALAARKTADIGTLSVPKIMVRNIPFQANQREILDLFRTFGEITAVRLPKKPGPAGEHRGFGFVHFTTQEAAKKAFDALVHSTHLYGRRLVLEWAKGEDTVEDIRKRTASHFVAGNKFGTKKKRVEFDSRAGDEDDE